MIIFNRIHNSIESKIEIILYHSDKDLLSKLGQKGSHLSGQTFSFFSLKVLIKVWSYVRVFTVLKSFSGTSQ